MFFAAVVHFRFDNLLGIFLALRAAPFAEKFRVTYIFTLFVAALALWQTGEAFGRASADMATAQFWSEIFGVCALFISPLGLHFAFLFSGRTAYARSPVVLFLLYAPVVLFNALARAGFTQQPLSYKKPWGWIVAPPSNLTNAYLGISNLSFHV